MPAAFGGTAMISSNDQSLPGIPELSFLPRDFLPLIALTSPVPFAS
jgi:hypothetical protein